MKKRERILIFNVNWLGDVLFSTAVIRNIRYNYPDSFIACVIPPRCYEVLKGNIHLDEIIIFDVGARHAVPLQMIKFVGYLRQKKFNQVFLLHRSFTRALITWFAGIPRRIGYYTPKRGFLLTSAFIAPSVESTRRIDYYLNIISQAGLIVRDKYTEFFVTSNDIKAAEEFLISNSISNDDFLVGVNPGGNWGPKRWPKENFIQLIDKLTAEFKAKIIITGSKEEAGLAEDIRKNSRYGAIVASGKLGLKQFAALTKRLNIFISADSAPLHIANAMGAKKIIALFGPTDPKLTGPYPADNVIIINKNTACRIPCYNVNCSNNVCMKKILVEHIIEEICKKKR